MFLRSYSLSVVVLESCLTGADSGHLCVLVRCWLRLSGRGRGHTTCAKMITEMRGADLIVFRIN